jgi:hypothetical protein
MHARAMFRFQNCRFARMSSGRYCLIRDLGLVKGGKGLRHHEVLIAFSVRAMLRRISLALVSHGCGRKILKMKNPASIRRS